MATFAMPDVPEPEDTAGMNEAKTLLARLHEALIRHDVNGPPDALDLSDLDKTNLGLVNQIMGEGEVAVVAGNAVQAQESVLAGVWRVHHLDNGGKLIGDTIEIGACPAAIRETTFAQAQSVIPPGDDTLPEGRV